MSWSNTRYGRLFDRPCAIKELRPRITKINTLGMSRDCFKAWLNLIRSAFCVNTRLFLSACNEMRTIVIIAIGLLVSLCGTNAKETLRLGMLFSQKGVFDFSGLIPAIDIAIETIEADETLPFTFTYTHNDSMCQAAASVRSFIGQVFSTSSDNPQIMLIGSDCSVATEPVAELSHNWNLVQISPASSSPRLSNTRIFPHFLRTVSSDAEIVVGIIQVMKQFQWSRIGLITQSENIFTFIATRMKEDLAAANLQLIREYTFNSEENVTQAMMSLKNSPVRIVFLNMYSEHATEAMCFAYRNKMYHPQYAWMFFNWYMDGWWFEESSCAEQAENLEAVIETSIVFDHYPRIEEDRMDDPNIGKITWNDYYTEQKERFEELEDKISNDTSAHTEDSAYMFDAIWTAALALNKTKSRLDDKNLTFRDFTYDDKHGISDIIYEEALKVKFFGLTGDVCFNDNGDRPGQVRLLQYKRDGEGGLSKVQLGKIANGDLAYDDGLDDHYVFQGNIAQDEEHVYIELGFFITYTIFSILGIIFAIICLIFNLWFRNQKLVRLGSPYVNTVIVAGAVVFYVTVILFGVDENVASYSTVDGLCHGRIWVVAIGFSLLYGTIFAKTWRIYYIFNHARPNSKFEVKDIYLFGIVGILVLADIIFLIPPTAVSSARLGREYREIEGDEVHHLPKIIGICTAEGSLAWLPVLFAFKGIALLTGLFLAFETRKVKIKSLNESRFVAMSVYGAVIVSVALTPIGFFLENLPSTQYAIMGIMILLSTSLILGLVFVTKMYRVYRDPEGKRFLEENSVNRQASTINNKMTVSNETEEDYKKRIESLNEEVKVLNDELEKYKSGRFEYNGVITSEKVNVMNGTSTQDDDTRL